jgi:uncharacterized protein YPO0396
LNNILNLFDTENPDSGFRLIRLEIFNWGTFDGGENQVWQVFPNGKSSLLTGRNGSGKTTLVDAILTLLVPPAKRFYSQSSGSQGRKERSEVSYVKGAYRKVRDQDRISPEILHLRDENDFSLLLGIFANRDTKETVSIGQLRWFSNHELKRQYFLVPRDLSICSHIHPIDPKGAWKKSLTDRFGAEFFSTFTQYSQRFSKIFGFRSDKALALFSQTAGIKEMDNLNEFIRNHMLEENNVEDLFQKLISNFQNLDNSHRSIIKAGLQLERLEPVVETGKIYEAFMEEQTRLESLAETVDPWFANQKNLLLTKTVAKKQEKYARIEERIKKIKLEIEILDQKKGELIAAISANKASARLSEINLEINRLVRDKKDRQEKMEKYNRLARKLGLPEDPDDARFFETNAFIRDEKLRIHHESDELHERLSELKIRKKELKSDYDKAMLELESLRQRENNIPESCLEIRKKIAEHTGVDEKEIPFLGELVRIKDSELAWENAIEHLMGDFGTGMLIPEALYSKVTRFINETNTNGNAIYFKIPERISPPLFEKDIPQNCLFSKLEFKANNPLSGWAGQEILDHLDFMLIRNLEDLRRLKKALTPQGLIKNNDLHHKDDSPETSKRTHFILGWDNTRKILEIQKEAAIIDKKIKESEHTLRDYDQMLKNLREKIESCSQLSNYEKFTDLDWQSFAAQIEELKAEKKQLEESSDQLRQLQRQKESVERSLSEKRNHKEEEQSNSHQIRFEIQNHEKEIQENNRILDHSKDVDLVKAGELLVPYLKRCAKDLDLVNFESIQKVVTDEIKANIQTLRKKLDQTKTILTKLMNEYKHGDDDIRSQYPDWTGETRNLETEPSYLDEYRRVYTRIKSEDLPGYRQRFKKYLNEQVVYDIANFNTALDRQVSEIRAGIQEINESLKEIDYSTNPSTYLRLIDKDETDIRIREFKRMIRQAMPDQIALIRGDDTELEASYYRINELIEKMKSETLWRKHVTDTRNWLRFGAEERYREDSLQKQYYEDSQSLSGGQKSKLAYTILASAIAYQFGIQRKRFTRHSFRFVVVDEAFSKVDPENAEYAMELFKRLNLQVMVVTPMDKIAVAEKFVSTVHYVQNKRDRESEVFDLTIQEYQKRKETFQKEVSGYGVKDTAHDHSETNPA